jgi:hypothetical protein
VTSAKVDAAIRFYDILAESAKPEKHQGVEISIFRGSLTRAWNAVGASNSYYSQVMRFLYDSGCLHLVQRGAASTPSVVAVIKRPEPNVTVSSGRLTTGPNPATLIQEVENIKRNVGGINIAEALAEIESRLEKLEREEHGKKKANTKSTATRKDK